MLQGIIEADETYIGGKNRKDYSREDGEPRKRGRGTAKMRFSEPFSEADRSSHTSSQTPPVKPYATLYEGSSILKLRTDHRPVSWLQRDR